MTDEHRDESSVVRQYVAAHPFVKGMADSDVAMLQDLGRLAEHNTGERIFEAGAPADRFFLIRTGVVSLQLSSPAGGTPRQVQAVKEGSALGWSWLFEPYVWQFDAVAETPVRAIVYDASELRSRLEADKECGYRVVMRVAEVMAERLHATRLGMLSR
ncbi:MAG TPA: cyclic nucleotide-binding domain-containing protein [Acidimicrobiia bacterium]